MFRGRERTGEGRKRKGRMTEVSEGEEKMKGKKMEVREERREGVAVRKGDGSNNCCVV
jgi:hypothetical protein